MKINSLAKRVFTAKRTVVLTFIVACTVLWLSMPVATADVEKSLYERIVARADPKIDELYYSPEFSEPDAAWKITGAYSIAFDRHLQPVYSMARNLTFQETFRETTLHNVMMRSLLSLVQLDNISYSRSHGSETGHATLLLKSTDDTQKYGTPKSISRLQHFIINVLTDYVVDGPLVKGRRVYPHGAVSLDQRKKAIIDLRKFAKDGDLDNAKISWELHGPGAVYASQPMDDSESSSIAAQASGAFYGTISANPDGTLTYAPPGNFIGTDLINVKIAGERPGNVYDNFKISYQHVLVAIEVKKTEMPPSLDDSAIVMNRNAQAEMNLLLRATAPNGDLLTATITTPPTHGSLVKNDDGIWVYRPAKNYFGTDRFSYRVSDGKEDSPVATVRIGIK